MTGGHYRMERGWLDHPVFGSEPFCRRTAWAWLIEEAAWRDTKIGVGGKTITLKRGQLTFSLRRIAEIWRWKKDAVARFLGRLQAEGMIVLHTKCRASVAPLSRLEKTETESKTVNETGQLLISISNYDTYQYKPDPGETGIETEAATAPRQRCDRSATHSEEKKEGKKEEPNGSSPPYSPPKSDFDRFWKAYPHKVGKGAALKAFKSAIRKTDIETMLSAIERYIAAKPADRPYANPTTWLNQERWLDEFATGPPGPADTGLFTASDSCHVNGTHQTKPKHDIVADREAILRGVARGLGRMDTGISPAGDVDPFDA